MSELIDRLPFVADVYDVRIDATVQQDDAHLSPRTCALRLKVTYEFFRSARYPADFLRSDLADFVRREYGGEIDPSSCRIFVIDDRFPGTAVAVLISGPDDIH